MKKIFRKLHLWLSVPFGLVIAVTCFSGAMLVFEDEIMHAMRRDLYFVESVGDKPLPMEQLAAAVQASLPEGVEVTGMTVFDDPRMAWQARLSAPRRAVMAVDQYTGQVKGQIVRAPFFQTMFRLHRWLMDTVRADGFTLGKTVVGISTLAMALVLITGIVIWMPRTVRALRGSLTITFRRGWKRFWYGLHAAGGMYAVVLLLAMALTGLTWSFQWYRTGFYALFGAELQGGGGHGHGQGQGGRADATPDAGRFAVWERALEETARLRPDYIRMTVTDGNVSVPASRFGNSRAADSYSFDTGSGAIEEVSLYRDSDRSSKLRGWIYSVHVGNWGGMVTRILTFLAALLGASLPLTGYYLWIRRLVMRRRASHPARA